MPPGLIGNPTTVPRCTEEQFVERQVHPDHSLGLETQCPLATVVGVAAITSNEPANLQLHTSVSSIFNLTPEKGEPARFGFYVDEVAPVFLDTAIRSGGDYGLTVGRTTFHRSLE